MPAPALRLRYPFTAMDQESIIEYIDSTFAGVEVLRPEDGPGAGDTFFFWDPNRDIDPTKRQPFATIVVKDYGDFDSASKLDRPGVFRLNIGISRESFTTLFGHSPTSSGSWGVTYDYAALDRLMPHPTYASQSYICVLNPGDETFEKIKPLLAEAYNIAAARYAK